MSINIDDIISLAKEVYGSDDKRVIEAVYFQAYLNGKDAGRKESQFNDKKETKKKSKADKELRAIMQSMEKDEVDHTLYVIGEEGSKNLRAFPLSYWTNKGYKRLPNPEKTIAKYESEGGELLYTIDQFCKKRGESNH